MLEGDLVAIFGEGGRQVGRGVTDKAVEFKDGRVGVDVGIGVQLIR